jgi:hypothetical protein
MRQGWVVSIYDNKRKETSYRIAWGTMEEAYNQSNKWERRIEKKGKGDQYSVRVTFPYAEYESTDYVDIRCTAACVEDIRALLLDHDAYADADPDVSGGFIVEAFHDEFRDVLEILRNSPLVSGSRVIPDLGKLIDDMKVLKEQVKETG